MKSIFTLIEDIYKLFIDKPPTKKPTKAIEKAAAQFAERVKQHVLGRIYEERSEKDRRNLRLSQIGRPARQVFYDVKGYKETVDPSGPTQIKFLYGNILEELLILLSTIAGHKVQDEQKEVILNGVVGHKDCRIDGVTVDIKSTSSYAFKKFENGSLASDDPFGYIGQLSAYAQAEGDKEAAFFAIDKQRGTLALSFLHDLEMEDASTKIDNLRTYLDDNHLPPRCYADIPEGTSGNRKLAIGCVFCPYKFGCWADANGGRGIRTFDYANGPRFFTQVLREPNVPEL
tara:strand:- start:4926 stop:5786 length:861 start_codon:yes stop_codon:yes gene_type:complete